MNSLGEEICFLLCSVLHLNACYAKDTLRLTRILNNFKLYTTVIGRTYIFDIMTTIVYPCTSVLRCKRRRNFFPRRTLIINDTFETWSLHKVFKKRKDSKRQSSPRDSTYLSLVLVFYLYLQTRAIPS